MKRTGRYVEPKDSIEPPTVPGMSPTEQVLGWYRNPEPWESSMIVFTDKAIYSVDKGDVVRIAMSEIVGYEPPTSKAEVMGVRVKTQDGSHFLRAAGSFGQHGNQKDAFCLIMVLGVVAASNLK